MQWTPRKTKFLLNIYGPFKGAGISIDFIRNDWREVHVSMKMRWYNRNIVGAHFGGSLYAMVDPQYMLMLMNILGPKYIVWDKAADIEFVRPGRGKVFARFELSEAQIDEIKVRTASGEKYLPCFQVDIVDDQGGLIAKVNKTLYVRQKPPK